MDGLCPEGVGYPRFRIPFASNVSEYPFGHSETLVGSLGCLRFFFHLCDPLQYTIFEISKMERF